MSEQKNDTETIHELLGIMHEHDLDRIKVRVGEAVFELVRREAGMQVVQAPLSSASLHVAATPASAPGPAAAPANVKKVVAPLTGVFYRSASPDSDVFVSEGSRVNEGDVLCILEAMKLFNEIQSDYAGSIVRIVPGNGELVSQGEDLFWIAP